jgi:ParB-like chromosome segregation protein Spo0J
MTLVRESPRKVHEIPVEKLVPNPWNPNRMSKQTYAKLKAYVKREGLVEPLIVRWTKEGHQLLGGYHRWMIAKELGYETVPCIVLKLNDKRAKILSINLNELKGQSEPDLLADLVHDLSHDMSLEDLATQLPYDLADLRDLSDLKHIPDGLDLELEEEAKAMERKCTKVMSFPLTPEQNEAVEGALETAKEVVGGASRSAALTFVAREFMRGFDSK